VSTLDNCEIQLIVDQGRVKAVDGQASSANAAGFESSR
jgi:hypothetical protein